jgi:hypothetical protein
MEKQKNLGPYAKTRLTQYLAKRIDSLHGVVSQADIARALDYEKANIISMFKTGMTKVPLDKIPALAEVLRVDPAHLMKLGLEQYWPGRINILNQFFEQMVTANELELVKAVREAAGDTDYKFRPETLAEIRELVQNAISSEKSVH